MTWDLLLQGGRVIDSSGEADWDIAVRRGRIAALGKQLPRELAREVIDAGGLHIFPGLIDPHVHYGYAGELADQFRSETGSAALGGVTTVLLFHRDGTDYRQTIPDLIRTGERESCIDFAIHAGILTPAQAARIPELLSEGISSFKFYLAYRGRDNRTAPGFPRNAVDDALLLECFRAIARASGAVACVHCENSSLLEYYRERATGDSLAAWHASRPGLVEAEAVQRAAFFAEAAGCPLYVVHLSSREGLAEARAARSRYPRVVVETCPHYLTLTDQVSAGNLAKVSPSIKGECDREALWEGIGDGTIETLGTDHCPVPRERKDGTIWDATPGFPGSGTLLPLLLHTGYHERGLSLPRIAELTAAVPARTFGLWPRKGTIRPGADADLAVVNLEYEQTITAAGQRSAANFSVWEGWRTHGWPMMTFSRGELIARDGQLLAAPGRGDYLPRLPA